MSLDIEPPQIYPCPGDMKIISKVRWRKLQLPTVTVTDNVGVSLFTTNMQNESEVTWGEYNITYSAADIAGNRAYCIFLITITGMYRGLSTSAMNSVSFLFKRLHRYILIDKLIDY